MHPVPRLADQLLKEWAEELSMHLNRSVADILNKGLSAADFPTGDILQIKLMDDSVVQFACAFHVVNPKKFAIAVFTEHCGYHLYPFHDAVVSRINTEVLYSEST